MNILYLISSPLGSVGGHVYSLMTTEAAMSKVSNTNIVLLCNIESLAFKACKSSFTQLSYTDHSLCMRQLRQIVKDRHITVIHSFDSLSHSFAKKLSRKTGASLVITKPGGPTTRYSYPYAHDMIVFHEMDRRFFTSHPYFRTAKIHCLPNRVLPAVLNRQRAAMLEGLIPRTGFRFMAICRFSLPKVPFFLRCVELIRRLSAAGVDAECIVIGAIQDAEAYDKVRAASGKLPIRLLTGQDYVVNASEFIPAADAVITMGRSTLESASYGKPVLCCAQNLSIPFLLGPDTLNASAEENFTSRACIAKNEDLVFAETKALVEERAIYEKATDFSIAQFHKDWNICNVVDRYMKIYESARPVRTLPFERLLEIASCLLLHPRGNHRKEINS